MRLVAVVALLASVLSTAHVVTQSTDSRGQTARWVAEQIELRDIGRDSRLELTMRLIDRQGRVRERSLTISTLRGKGSNGDRVLLRFQAPNDIKGTAFLVWEHPNTDDERFLYLPALGRVRRIAGAEKQDSFVGSDLTYEDIGGRELDDYTYAFVQRDASWTAPDGGTYPAWQLESRTVDPQAAYPRTVSLVRKDNFVLVAADIYNRRDERTKHYEIRRLQQVDNIWTAMDVVMVNEVQHTRTELNVARARYNIGLSESDFSRRVLEQGEHQEP
jgi:hypothetical protein